MSRDHQIVRVNWWGWPARAAATGWALYDSAGAILDGLGGSLPRVRTRPLLQGLLYALLFFLFVPIPAIGPLPVAPENLLYLFLFVVLATLGSHALNRRLAYVARNVWPFLAFGLLDALLTYAFDDVVQVEFYVVRRLLLVLAFVLAVDDDRSFRRVYGYLIFVVATVSVFALLVVWVGGPFSAVRDFLLAARGARAADELGHLRAAGVTGSVFGFSYVVAALPPLALGGWLRAPRARWLVAFAVGACALVSNAERSAIAVSALACIALLFAQPRRRAWITLVVLFVVSAATVIAYRAARNDLISAEDIFHRVQVLRQGNVASRFGQQWAGLRTIVLHPLRADTATYQEVAGALESVQEYEGFRGQIPWSHNHYINIGLTAGFLGLMLFAIFSWRIGKMLARCWTGVSIGAGRSPMHHAVVLALAAVAANAFFHNAGAFSGEPMSWALIGLCLATGFPWCRGR